VYHACSPDGTDLAIKVYKTSILVFKDRDRSAPSGLQHGPGVHPDSGFVHDSISHRGTTLCSTFLIPIQNMEVPATACLVG
jgi:hypothetical protein